MVNFAHAIRVSIIEPSYPSFALVMSKMEGTSDLGGQWRNRETDSARPPLQRTHSLQRTLTRFDDRCTARLGFAASPTYDVNQSRRPMLRRSIGRDEPPLEQYDPSSPSCLSAKPSLTTVFRVLIVDWCASVKDKCKSVV
ncbi:hypothetical protein ONZ51_g1276 [Trametes cubensis]|uniref:Uncharacterized protein n=1 Tax=Trametes cubensis TaxID=1111947 RepID=A0AAD7U2G3_9APHY|nr:hypothetical protein ONZ51_g1276 [Trametes cubensis]